MLEYLASEERFEFEFDCEPVAVAEEAVRTARIIRRIVGKRNRTHLVNPNLVELQRGLSSLLLLLPCW